jgi:hypothetical protein
MLKLNENQFANYLYLNRQVKDSTVKSLSYNGMFKKRPKPIQSSSNCRP